MRLASSALVIGLTAVSCDEADRPIHTQSPPAGPSAPPLSRAKADVVRTSFVADTPHATPGTEAYVCHVFDAQGIDGKLVGSVAWTPPSGPVAVHHASLFAARDRLPVGEIPCDPMPERVAAFGLYTPGAIPLELPAGTAIFLPSGTRRLVVVAHVLRSAAGAAHPTVVELGLVATAEHALNWVDVLAPVPTLYPHRTDSSIGVCVFDQPAHIVTDWPHMHRRGSAFLGLVVRADGHAETLLEMPKWDYEMQSIHRVDVQLEAGDAVETICTWENPTDDTVLPGPFVADEMCNQGLFVWPFEAARCAN